MLASDSVVLGHRAKTSARDARGLGDDDGCLTLTEVAAIVGVSRERVRQIEAVALRKMRIGLRLRQLLGPRRAQPVLDRLRGRGISDFKRALRTAKLVAT